MSLLDALGVGVAVVAAIMLIYVIARVVSTAFFISKNEQERRKNHG